MNKKITYSLLIIIVLIILLLAFNNLFDLNIFQNKEENNIKKENEEEEIEESETELNNEDQPQEEEVEETQETIELKEQLRAKAKIFIEKYGTYAAYNKKENYNELQGLVTTSLLKEMNKEANNIIEGLQTIKTIAATIKITEFNEDKVVSETEIRQTIKKEEETEVVYKTATITFKNLNNDWRVDDVKIK